MTKEDRSFEYGMPQPTEREREWAIKIAKIIVRMVREHKGSKSEIESQIARELYCSVAILNAGN